MVARPQRCRYILDDRDVVGRDRPRQPGPEPAHRSGGIDLQLTASSVDDLTGSVHQNSQAAAQANDLAGRCAGAAREIRDLIGGSVEKVAFGTRLVDSAGAAMQETHRQRVPGIVGREPDLLLGGAVRWHLAASTERSWSWTG